MEEGDGNDSDSTVLLDDYDPEKIAAKRRKLAERHSARVPVTTENDDDKDIDSIQTDGTNTNPSRPKNRADDIYWRINKYFTSMHHLENTKDAYSYEELKIKRELLKQETDTDDVMEQDYNGDIESNKQDDGVIIIEDSDDGSVVGNKEGNDPNFPTSSDVQSRRYKEEIANVSRTHSKPSAINGRRATINHSHDNEAMKRNKLDNQPRLIKVLKPATINSRRVTIDFSELTERFRVETQINNQESEETEHMTVKTLSEFNILQVDETTKATNEDIIVINDSQSNADPSFKDTKCSEDSGSDTITDSFAVDKTINSTNVDNIVSIDSQSNDDTNIKHTKFNEASKTDTTADSLAVDKTVKILSSYPECIPNNEDNKENDITQRKRHKHKAKKSKRDKKNHGKSDENSPVIAESLRNENGDLEIDPNHGSISEPHNENTNLSEEVVNVYVNANEISRKRLSVDITPGNEIKRIRDNKDQSNDTEHVKTTVRNNALDCSDISEMDNASVETDGGPAIDEPSKIESGSVLEAPVNTNDADDSEEVLDYEEIGRVIKLQVGFCTLLKGNLEEYCEFNSNDSEKVKAYLKSVESLTNEIENLKTLAYDRRVKATTIRLQYACPVCTRVSIYSASLLFSNNDNRRNVETGGKKCKFCRGIGNLYNSHMTKYLLKGNKSKENDDGSNIAEKSNQITHTSPETCNDGNDRAVSMPIKPLEKPDNGSRRLSKESNNTIGSVPEAATLGTSGKDGIEHNNDTNRRGVTSSEGIEESKKILPVLTPSDNSLTKITISNIGTMHENDGSHIIDKLLEKNNNEVVKNIPNISEEAIDSYELTVNRNPCEATLLNTVSTINNDNIDHRGEITDTSDDRTTQRLSNKVAIFESTINVDTSTTGVTTDELPRVPSVLQNISPDSERNYSNRTENRVTDDDNVNSKLICKNNDSFVINSTTESDKRKTKVHELKKVFKRIKTCAAAEQSNEETSLQKEPRDEVSGQDLSNNPEDANKSTACEKKETSHKRTMTKGQKIKIVADGLDVSNVGGKRSHTRNIRQSAQANELSQKQNEHCNDRGVDSEPNRTESYTDEQNINDESNKTNENFQHTVEDKENIHTSETNKTKEVNKKTNPKDCANQKVPDNQEPNDTDYDTHTEDGNTAASELGDADTISKLNERRVSEKDDNDESVNKDQQEPRKGHEENDSSEDGTQGLNDNSIRRLKEPNHEAASETADDDDEDNENSADEISTSDDESNNTIRKTLEECFKKIKNNLYATVADSQNEQPPKKLKNKVSNQKDFPSKISKQGKLDIKGQVQYMCHICTCVFTYGGRFLSHMFQKHKMDVSNIPKQCVKRKCFFCHVFLEEKAVNLHVKQWHSEEYIKIGVDIKSERKSNVIDEVKKTVVNNNKNEPSKKVGKWKYYCLICKLTMNSDYSARRHRKDKHPSMKNVKLYEKMSTDEYELKSPRNHTEDIDRDSEYDSNEACSENESSQYETDEETDKDHDKNNHDEDSNDEDEKEKENDQNSSGDDTDADCDKNEEDYDPNQSSEKASSDEGEINSDDNTVPNINHRQGNRKNKLNEEALSESTDEGDNDNFDDDDSNQSSESYEKSTSHSDKLVTRLDNSKARQLFKCTKCQVSLNSDYAVRKHRKDKHPNLKKKKIIIKVFIDDNTNQCTGKSDKHLTCEKEPPTRNEDGSDINSYSDEDHIDESNSDIENDANKEDSDDSNVIDESSERSEDVDENSDTEHEGSENDDSIDEEKDEQNIMITNTPVTNQCNASGKTDKILEEPHENACNNLQSANSSNSKICVTPIRRYQCTVCKVTLDSLYAVRKHRIGKHPDVKHKWLVRKVIPSKKNQQDIVQENNEERQETSDDDMRAESNTIQDSNNENTNRDDTDIAEQCNSDRNEINNSNFNDQIEDNSNNCRSAENNTEDADTESCSFQETLIEDQSHLNKTINKNIDDDKKIMHSIDNNINLSVQNAYKCTLCKEYFQSVHFMRIHREREHPLMNNVKLFEKVVINTAKEKNSTKNEEFRVEDVSKINNATGKESQHIINETSNVEKVTNTSEDKNIKTDNSKNVGTNETVKKFIKVQNSVDDSKEQSFSSLHQNKTSKNIGDKSTPKKDSRDREDNFQKNKMASKLNKKLEENTSDVRTQIYSNCYVCAINLNVNENHDHICTLMKEKDVFHNCYACGVNFVNDAEHLCSCKYQTWIDNIKISNVVTIKEPYVFSCSECKYSSDVYDDFLKHCQNHYIDVVDAVKYCGRCELNFDEHRYNTHQNLHAKLKLIYFSYTSLFSNWDAIFDDIPGYVATELKTQSIYTTHSIRMAIVEDGPYEYSLYQCDQCKSCVPKPEIENHCLSKCSDMNYVCSVCDRAFISYEMCVNHEFTHRNGAKIFRVIVFNRRDDRKHNLKLIESRELQKVNIKANSPTAELFQCQCDLCFVAIENFKRHFLECNSPCQNGILCPKCPVTRIFLADELDKHLQLHHAEVVFEFVINQINIRRVEPNEVKCETGTTERKELTSSELATAELTLKKELIKQDDDTIVISDDDD